MKRASNKHFDLILLGLTLAATVVGLVFILDAGYARAIQAGRSQFSGEFRSQIVFLIPAVIGFFIAGRINPSKWFEKSKLIWCAVMFLLIAVEVVGTSRNGAKRWLGTETLGVQPAEFAKLATVIYLAAAFAFRSDKPLPPRKNSTPMQAFWHYAKRYMPAIWVLIAVILIEAEPDMGTGAVVAATAFAMFFPAGVRARSIAIAVGISLFGVFAMIAKQPYRLDRIVNHTQRWDAKNLDDVAYQTVQSEAAMAEGGFYGVGIGAGRAKHVMPATTTDFVMATVGEEFGFLGAMVVLGILGGLVWRLMFLASRATSRFRMLVLYGVAAWIGIQACVNVMMANGTLPAIGIPLPFISSGGSSLIALWFAIGICQSMLMPESVREEDIEISHNGRGHRRPRYSGTGRRGTSRPTRSKSEVPRVPTGPRG